MAAIRQWLERPRDRREFLRQCARHGALAALAAGCALLTKRRGPVKDDHRCYARGVCSRCRAFPRCRLPAALSARLYGGAVGRGGTSHG